MRVNGARLRKDLERLAEFGREPTGGVSRPAFSEADMAARAWFAARAHEAGLDARTDPVGNVIVRPPRSASDELPAVWTGSHLDSVPNGGMFDGALGAMAALECVRRIHETGTVLARPLCAVAFADEEGAFHGYLGSKALVQGFSRSALEDVNGRDGRRLVDALRAHGTGPGDAEAAATLLPERSVHRFLELHIEQGPVLETSGTTIGVVTGIVGVNRGDVRFDGRSDHAGTTPMHLRRDAVRGAASFLDRLTELPALAGRPGAVVTCGHLDVRPSAENVVAETAVLHLDFRDTTTEGLERLEESLVREAGACAARHGLEMHYHRASTTPPVRLDAELSAVIERAATGLGLSSRRLPSGAGHDAQVMAAVAPTGMIFVPSRDGRSHSPRESTSWEDVAHGADVLLAALLEVAGVASRPD